MDLFEQIAAIDKEFPWFFAFWAFVFGACWGSFFNVVIYRVPAGKSVVKPGSHCYGCGAPIKWYDNLPILSWCILRGKARCCGAPFSIRYALIEALTGGLFMWTWITYGPSLGLVVCIWLFISLMICNAFIDLDTQYLLDAFTVWGMMLGVVLSALYPELHSQAGSGDPVILERIRSVSLSMTGAVVGAGVILWIGMCSEKFLRKETMGFGDVLLMGCVGAFVGWKGAVFAFFGGSILGSIAIVPMMLFNKLSGAKLRPGKIGHVEEMTPAEPAKAPVAGDGKPDSADAVTANDNAAAATKPEEELGMQTAIPFGPWLSLGAIVYLLALKVPVDQYFESMKALIFSPVQPY